MADLNSHPSSWEEINNSPKASVWVNTIIDESSYKTLNILSIPSVVSDALDFLKTVWFEETPEMIELKEKIQKESLDSSNYNLLINNYTTLAQELANKDKSNPKLQVYSLTMIACLHKYCGNNEKYWNSLNDAFDYTEWIWDDELLDKLEEIFC